MLDQKKLLITDTTMRDAHQSLLSTRVRTRDMLKGRGRHRRDSVRLLLPGDVGRRHLRRGLPLPPRDPPGSVWTLLREKIPNIPFQMLLRGANAVGYTNYPDNLIRAFVKEAATVAASTCSACSTP